MFIAVSLEVLCKGTLQLPKDELPDEHLDDRVRDAELGEGGGLRGHACSLLLPGHESARGQVGTEGEDAEWHIRSPEKMSTAVEGGEGSVLRRKRHERRAARYDEPSRWGRARIQATGATGCRMIVRSFSGGTRRGSLR